MGCMVDNICLNVLFHNLSAGSETLEFSKKFFTEFNEFSDKIFVIRRIIVFKPATSCVRNRDATTLPERHRCKLIPNHASVIYKLNSLNFHFKFLQEPFQDLQ